MAMAINSVAMAAAVCSLVVVLFVGGCSPAALPEATLPQGSSETSAKGMDSTAPVVPYVAASMDKISCQTKDTCTEALNSTIDRVECVDGTCGCLYNHVFSRGTCLRKIDGDDGVTQPGAGVGAGNMTEEGSRSQSQRPESESSTSSPGPDKATADADVDHEPTQPDTQPDTQQGGSTGQVAKAKTAQEPDAQSKPMEPENLPTASSPPETTTVTPATNEEIKEAAPSNVEPVDSPRGETETTIQPQPHVDGDSMQGDQPQPQSAQASMSTEMPKVGLLQNCSSSLQCEWQDAACVDGACECKEGYVINPAQDRCLRVASKMNDMCVEDIQCIGKLSDSAYCSNNMCVCKVGTIGAGGVCAVPKGLGEPCSAPGDCISGMVCNSGACACAQGSQPSDDKTRCIGNGASSTMASLAVLCLGLFSTLQLRRYA